jgi:hypothetical protein
MRKAIPPILLFAASLSPAAHADDLIAVAHTEDNTGDAQLATDVTTSIHHQLRTDGYDLATLDATVAAWPKNCPPADVTCARTAAATLHASHIITSSLFQVGSTYEVRLTRILLADSTSTKTVSKKALTSTEVLMQARQAALELLNPALVVGELMVLTDAQCDIYVDGVLRDATPLTDALRIQVGRHDVQLRQGEKIIYEQYVQGV